MVASASPTKRADMVAKVRSEKGVTTSPRAHAANQAGKGETPGASIFVRRTTLSRLRALAAKHRIRRNKRDEQALPEQGRGQPRNALGIDVMRERVLLTTVVIRRGGNDESVPNLGRCAERCVALEI